MEAQHKALPKGRGVILLDIALNVAVIAIIAVTSCLVLRSMAAVEEERCFDILRDNVETMEREIAIQLNNNLSVLRIVSGAMAQEARTGADPQDKDLILQHLDELLGATLFTRIDVLFPNDTILLQTGELRETTMDFDFIAAKGPSVSGRRTDTDTGHEVVRMSVPVVVKGQPVAVLLGVLNCHELPRMLRSTMYDGQAYVCLVDRNTGDFIMDDWHDTLGNLYQMKQRETLPGYENVDPRVDIKAGKSGSIAYKSDVNRKASYMYYHPMDVLPWEVLVMVQEDVAFASLNTYRRLLVFMAVINVLALAGYLGWSLWSLRNTLHSAAVTEKLSYSDALTGLYNQNKFTVDMDAYGQMSFRGVGLLFVDLNGLKYTNDHFGHAAGDRLLQSTADTLREVFGYTVYRIGGDEFVALALNIAKADFTAKNADVKQRLEAKDVQAAMGATWYGTSHFLKEQLKEADELMYSDKQQYHKLHTELDE